MPMISDTAGISSSNGGEDVKMIPLPQQRRFESRQFPPAFDMILPEGQRRQRIETARKIVRTDDFALLHGGGRLTTGHRGSAAQNSRGCGRGVA
jgi:HipA N-terminal domain